MDGKPPIITACHFHFQLLQSLRMYESLLPFFLIFELHGSQLDEDKSTFLLISIRTKKLYFKNLEADGTFKAFLSPSFS